MLERYKNLIFAVVMVAIVSGVVALLTYRPAPVVITIIPPGPTSTPLPIRVYVIGAVVAPDTYALPSGSRVQDAILVAGGARSDADLKSINLAQIVHDGDKISVPSVSTGGASDAPNPTSFPSFGGSSDATPAKGGKVAKGTSIVHINTASLDEIQSLPGVGPALAQRIIDYRTKNGPFKSLDDLGHVSGIGPARLKEWANLIAFD